MELVLLTAAYSVIFLAGLAGNASAIVAMRKGTGVVRSSSSVYLVNLAASDLVNLLSGLPFDVRRRPSPSKQSERSVRADGSGRQSIANQELRDGVDV